VKQLEDSARSALESGHLNSCLSLCERALAAAPGNDRVRLIQAEVYIKMKNIGDADRILTAILRKDSNATDAL
jgi:predicted Zn-dependent protease